MPDLLAIASHGSTGRQQVVSVSYPGSTDAALGGTLGRINKRNVADSRRMHNAAVKFLGKVFSISPTGTLSNFVRVHRFIPDTATNKVRRLRLTGNPTGGTVTAGQTVTGPGGSPAIATVAENYQTSDLFVVTTGGNGVDFANGDALSFSGGASATITASAGVEDNGGDHIQVFVSANANAGGDMFATGLYNYVTSTGAPGLCFVYFSAAGTGYLVRTTDGVTWTETSLGTLGTTKYQDLMVDGLLYVLINGPTIVAVNPATAAVTSSSIMSTGDFNFVLGSHGGKVIAASYSSGGTIYYVQEVTGGLAGPTLYGSTNSSGQAHVVVKGVNEDAFYVGSQNGLSKLFLNRIAIINGNLVWNGHTSGTDSIGDKMLPAGLLSNTNNFWGNSFSDDAETPGSRSERIFLASAATLWALGYTVTEYLLSDPWQSLSGGVSYTWNGTIGNSNDVVAITGHGIVVGDYLLHVASNKVFKVAAVSGNNIQLENFSGAGLLPIPSTPSETRKAIVGWTSVGGAVIGTEFARGEIGGGERIYTPGEITADIVDTEALLGAEELSFVLRNDGASASCKVAVYYTNVDDNTVVQATLTNPSVGSISADENIGLTCDDGATVYTVRASLPPSGFRGRQILATAT